MPQPAADRAPDAPLLDGATLRLDARRVRKLVRDLRHEARRSAGATASDSGATSGVEDDDPKDTLLIDAATNATRTAESDALRPASRPRRLDAMALLRAGIMQDVDAVERAATASGADAGRLSVIAQLAAMPLLRACAVRLRDQIPPGWLEGYCPMCGAWPALAELRGLERNRRLRCGRCAADWSMPVLHCPFCNELHHDRLHSLLPEGHEQTRRVDTCDTCKGYIKTFSSLQPMPLRALVTTDLASVELDIVAQERGYARPSRSAHGISVEIERTTRPARAPSPEVRT